MNAFVLWARKQKEKKELSYREIAKKVGWSHNYVFLILSGRRALTMDTVALLSVALGDHGDHGDLDVIGNLRKAGLLPVQLPVQLPMKNQPRAE